MIYRIPFNILMVFLAGISFSGFGQTVSLSTDAPNTLSVCGAAGNFEVTIKNNSATDTVKNGELTVRMPVGMYYNSKSVTGTGVTEKNITKRSRPVFSLPKINPGNSLKVTIKATPGCGIISFLNSGNVATNTVVIKHANGSDSATTKQYAVNQPSLSVVSISNQTYTGIVGDTFTRKIVIRNSGSGYLRNLSFYMITGSGIKVNSVGGAAFTRSGDSLKFNLTTSDLKNFGDKDTILEQGESVVLYEHSTVLNCKSVGISYVSQWGCNSSFCKKSTSYSNVIITNKTPNVYVRRYPTLDKCYDITKPNRQSLLIVSYGSGPARDVILDVFQTDYIPSGYYNNNKSYIDINSITVKYGKRGKVDTVLADSTVATQNWQCFNTTNPKGRFLLNLGLLKRLDSVYVEWDVYNCCADNGYEYGWAYEVSYNDQCGNGKTSYGPYWGEVRDYQGISYQTLTNSNVRIGANTTVYVNNGTLYLFNGTAGKNYLKLEWTYPKGVKPDTSNIKFIDATGAITWKPDKNTLSGNLTSGFTVTSTFYLPAPSGFSFVNPILAFTFQPYIFSGSVSCGGNNTINLKSKYVADSSCSNKCEMVVRDQDFKVNFDCVNSSALGLENVSFNIKRSNFGLPDTNDNGIPEVGASHNFNKVKADRAMFGDTLASVFRGRVIAYGSITGFKYGKGEIVFPENRYGAVSANIKIYDKSRNRTYTCANVPKDRDLGTFTYDFNPDTLRARGCNSIPTGFAYEINDSIILKTKHKVISNIGNAMRFQAISTDFYLSTTQNPTSYYQKYAIGQKQGSFALIGYYFTNYGPENRNGYGCRDISFSQYFYLSIGPCCNNYGGGNLFPYEYRNWGNIKDIVLLLPSGYNYSHSDFGYYRTAGIGKTSTSTVSNVKPYRISNDSVYFRVDSLFRPLGGTIWPSDDGFHGYLTATFKANCSTSFDVQENLTWIQTFSKVNGIGGGTETVKRDNQDYVTYKAPYFNIQPSFTTVDGLSDTVEWDIYISNAPNYTDADYTFLRIEDFSGKLIPFDVREKGSSSQLTLQNGLYRIGKISGGQQKTIRVRANYLNCVRDSLRIYFGWQCDNYPDSFEAYNCPFLDTLVLYVNPKSPGLNLNVSAPSGSVSLCDTSIYQVTLANILEGNAHDIELNVRIPKGVKMIPGSFYMKYPLTSWGGSISAPTSTGNFWYRWKIDSLSTFLEQNGLPGVLDKTKNKILLSFKVTTNCDFISGSQLLFNAKASNYCGTEVSNITYPTPGIDISGATAGYSTKVTISGPGRLPLCTSPTRYTLKVVNNGNDSTGLTDLLYLVLPKGITYVANSKANLFNGPAGEPTYTVSGTDNEYKWDLPTKLPPGDSMMFSFLVKGDTSLTCSEVKFFSRTTVFTNVSCLSLGSSCNIQVQTGSGDLEIEPVKPELMLSDLGSYSTPTSTGKEEVRYSLRLLNTGDTLRSGSGTSIKYYFDKDADGLVSSADSLMAIDTINVRLDSGMFTTISHILEVDPGVACRTIIIVDTAGGNCTCSPATLILAPVPLLNAGADREICPGSSTRLGTDSIGNYTYTWAPTTGMNDPGYAKPLVTLQNTTGNAIEFTYVLSTKRKTCTTSDTVIVKVNPLPVLDPGYDTSICIYDSIILGGNPTASGYASSYSYTWTPGATLNDSTSSNPVASPVKKTTYYLTVLGNDGCTAGDSVTISINMLPVADAGNADTVCFGDTVTLGGSPTGSGTTGSYSYSWVPTSGIIGANLSNPFATPGSTTTYTVTVTDQNSCKGSSSVIMKVYSLPVPNAGTDKEICLFDSVKIGNNPGATGGVTPFVFSWSNSGTLTGSTIEEPIAFPASTKNYILTVTDGNGCSNRDTAKVTVNLLPIADAGINDTICSGDSTRLGGINPASGGSGIYSYSWVPDYFLDDASASKPYAKPVLDTSYILTITDSKGCIGEDTIVIEVESIPIVNAGLNDTLCPGDTVSFNPVVTGASRYEWTPSGALTDPKIMDPDAFPSVTTVFELTAYTPSGCKASDSLEVYVRPVKPISPPQLHCVDYISDSILRISWDAVPANPEFYSYHLYKGNKPNGNYSKIASLDDDSMSTFTDSFAFNSQTQSYSYFLRVENKCGVVGSSSDSISSVVINTFTTGDKKLDLSWNPVAGKTTGRIYSLEADEGSGFVMLDSVSDTGYSIRSCYLSGKFRVKVRNLGGCSYYSSSTPTILIQDSTPPDVPLLTLGTVRNLNKIKLELKKGDSLDIAFIRINRGIAGGPISAWDTVQPQVKKYEDVNVNAGQNRYCYNLTATDTCGNDGDTSVTHCPVNLEGNSANLSAELYWSPYKGFLVDSQVVQRYNGSGWSDEGIILNGDSTFSDTGLTCYETYIYRLKTTDKTGNIVSYSDSISITPFDTVKPKSPKIKIVNVNDGKVLKYLTVSFTPSPSTDVTKYRLYYSKAGSSFSLHDSTVPPNQSFVFLPGPEINASYCFYIEAIDSCGRNISLPSDTHCTSYLTGNPGNLSNLLTWTPYKGVKVEKYYIYDVTGPGTQVIDSVKGTDTFYLHTGIPCNVEREYRIHVLASNGLNSFSNNYKLTPFDTIPPVAPSIDLVTVVSEDTIHIEFSKSPDADVNKYNIYYSSGGAYALAGTVNGWVTEFDHTGITTSKNSYCYFIRAIDSCGNNVSLPGDTHCVIQLAGQPGDLSAKLAWSGYVGKTVNNYFIWRKEANGWKIIDTLPGTLTTYKDSILGCNITQTYRVSGFLGNNLESFSDTVSVIPFDTIRPERVDILSASVNSSNFIRLRFLPVTDPDVNLYRVEVSVNGGGYAAVNYFSPGADTFVYDHKGINPLINGYCYRVVAMDSCSGLVSAKSETHCPVQLSGSPGNYQTDLSWSVYQGFSVDSYYIQRLNTSWNTIAVVAGTITSFSDTGLACDRNYTYRIKAVENGGAYETVYSDTIQLHPFDTVAPLRPVIDYVTVLPSGAFKLKWTSGGSGDVRDHIIYVEQNNILTPVDTVRDEDTFIYSTTGPGASLCFAVRAMDSCAKNLSRFSRKHCTVMIVADTTGCRQEVNLTWNNYSGWVQGIEKYLIYRKTQAGSWTLLDSVSGTITSYTDTGADYRNLWCYRLEAREDNGPGNSVSNISCIRPYLPPSPQIIFVTKENSSSVSGRVKIKWVSQDTVPNITHQQLFYKASSGGGYTLLKDSIPAGVDSFIHSGLDTRNADHSYYLRLLDACGTRFDKGAHHKTMDLEIAVGQLKHKLNWTPYEGDTVIYYLVERFEAGKFSVIDTLAPTDTSNIRYPAPCNFHLFYRIRSVLSNGETSLSDTMGRFAIDTIPPNPPILKNVTVSGPEEVFISFTGADSLDIFGYAVQRAGKNGVFRQKALIPFTTPGASHTFTDSVPVHKNRYCYTIVTLDSCLNAAASDTFCLIQLSGKAGNLNNRLTWTPFKGYPVSTLKVLRKTTLGWDTLAVLSGSVTSFSDTPLKCNAPKTYQIIGYEQGGNRITQSDTLIRTPFDTIIPQSPEIKYATVINSNTLKVYFDTVPDRDVVKYEIFLSSNGGLFSSFTTVGQKDSATQKVVLEGLDLRKNNYCLYVIAIDSCGENRSIPADTHCLIKPSVLPGNKAAHISWISYSGREIDKYFIERLSGTNWLIVDSISGDSNTYTDTAGLPCNVSQTYRISGSFSSVGGKTFSDTVVVTPFDTIRPVSPEINFVTVVDPGTIRINWQKSDKDVKLYEVSIRSENSPWLVIDTVLNGTGLDISGLNTRDSVYCVKLAAIDSCALNRSIPGRMHCNIRLNGTPGNLENHLSWNRYRGWDSIGGWVVYINKNGNWNPVDTLAPGAKSFTDTGRHCKKQYSYKVSAYSTTGNISFSDTVILTPYDTVKPVAPVPEKVTVAGNGVKIYWKPSVSADILNYEVYYKPEKGSFVSAGIQPHTGNSRYSFEIKNLRPDTVSYCFYLVATDSCFNNRSVRSRIHCTSELTATAGNLETNLKWTPYSGFSNTGYVVLKGGAYSWNIIDTTYDTFYTDTSGISCNTNYNYRLLAFGDMGDTSWSDVASATPFDTIAPLPVSLKFVSVNEGGSARVEWNWNVNSDKKYFEIWRSSGSGYSLQNTVTYDSVYLDNLSGHLENNRYYIVAIDSCRNQNRSVPSDTDQVIVPEIFTGACVPLVRLSWNLYSRMPMGADIYEVWRDGQKRAVLPVQNYYTDSQVVENNTYCYRVRAIDTGSGYSSFSDSICLSPEIFPEPDKTHLILSTVEKTGVMDGEVRVVWNRTVPADTFARGYMIYHSRSGKAGSYIPAGDNTDPGDTVFLHVQANTSDSMNYYYVVAYNLCNKREGVVSDTHRVINLEGINENLAVALNWTRYKGFRVDSYLVWKSTGQGKFKISGITTDTFPVFRDSSIRCNIPYAYKIEAKGEGVSWSDTVRFTGYDTIAPGRPSLNGVSIEETGPAGKVSVHFTGPKELNRKGLILYLYGQGGNYTPVDTFEEVSTDSTFVFDFPRMTDEEIISYYLRSFDSCGNISLPSDTHTSVFLKATAVSQANILSWSSYVGYDNPFYRVERKTNFTPWQVLTAWGKTDSFIDSMVKCDTGYIYRIAIREDSFGQRMFSNLARVVSFETDSPEAPVLKRVTVVETDKNDGRILVEWDDPVSPDVAFHNVYLRDNTSSWIKVDSFVTGTSTIIAGLNSYRNAYDFKVESYDSCGNPSKGFSSVHRNIAMTATAGNQQAYIKWEDYSGWKVGEYHVFRDGEIIAVLPPGKNEYTDTTVTCVKYYTYYIRAFSEGNFPIISMSGLDSVKPTDTRRPKQPYLITASIFKANSVSELKIKPSPNFDVQTYEVLRETNGSGNKKQIGFISEDDGIMRFFDSSFEGSRSVCYYVQALDYCGNRSKLSNKGCLVFLKGSTDESANILEWNEYTRFRNGVSKYKIYRKEDSLGWEFVASVVSSQRYYYDRDFSYFSRDFCYKIEAVESNSPFNAVSYSTELCINRPQSVYIPNIFSPSKTRNINDEFGPHGAFIKSFEMNILNRWGEKIFETKNSEPWSGMYKGEYLPEGMYIYQIIITGDNGEIKEYSGPVMILN